MSLGIQGRLTALYAGALFAALAICGTALYLAVLRLELSSMDDELQRAASTTAFGMKAEEQEGLDLRAAATDTEGELRIAGITLAMYDGDGRLLAARWEGFDPALIQKDNLREGLTTAPASRAQWRRLVTRQNYRGADYFVFNAVPLDLIGRHTALFRTAFLTIVPITFALAVGGGWFLSRSTLRPVIESQRRFMADASHELRTPVSVIRSAADITLSQPHRTTAEYHDTVSIIADQAKRLSRLVEDLFLLARADVQGRPLATSRFYLDDVLEECARAVEMLGAVRNVRVELTADKDIEIDADEDLVRRMLMNLLENAVRHTPDGTAVSVQLKRQNGRIDISVCDSGPGVPVDERERIFERFVRLDRTPGGAGLGLPIARWIAEAHGGSVSLAESSSSGSVFAVRLPASSVVVGR